MRSGGTRRENPRDEEAVMGGDTRGVSRFTAAENDVRQSGDDNAGWNAASYALGYLSALLYPPRAARPRDVGGWTVLKLGYKTSAEQFGPSELLQFSHLAEQSGFDSVFISDHFQPWKHHGGHAPFSLAWLGALGALTSRITIGTSVMTPTFRYHPAVVAQAFATLGVMFPDRIVLGVGTGESLNEVPSTGVTWPDFKERFARLREAVTLMRRLWTEERVTFEGQYYRTQNATIYDRPATPVPIYIAAAGALIAKYAGQMGDGLICTSGKARELYTETVLPKVLEGRGEAGPPAPDYTQMIEVKVSFDTDMKRALEDTRHWAVLALTPEEKISVHSPEEMERLAAGLSAERAASRWIVSTDPDEHVERIAYYVDLGFDHLAFHAPGPDQERFLRLYAERILPRLRRRFGAQDETRRSA